MREETYNMANNPSGPMSVAEMSKKTFKRLFFLFVAGVIVQAIMATENGQTPWIINMLETYFPDLMYALF